MARRDLIVSFLSSVPSAVQGMFVDKPLQLVCPVSQAGGGGYPGGRPGYQQWISKYADMQGNVIPGMFQAAGGQTGDSIGRVCVMGFSNGCIGVDEVLRKNDSAKIDLVLAIDGVHGAYMGDGKTLNPVAYKRFLNHAAHVAMQPSESPAAPVMCVTHSSIVPPGFPSTTETANFIWDKALSVAGNVAPMLNCGYDCPPVVNVSELAQLAYDKKLCSSVGTGCFHWDGFADGWYDRRALGNLFVMGWGDDKDGKITTRDPSGNADHIYQGRVILAELLKHFAVLRWNADCGIVASAASVSPLFATSACTLGDGLVYSQSDAAKVDYFPGIGQGGGGVVVPPCPTPPAGMVVVGKPGDPCWAVPAGNTAPPPVTPPIQGAPPAPSLLHKALWFGVGAAVGYGGVRLMTRD